MHANVTALYVDPEGHYPALVADWYDEARDARTYAGPRPVVAHPPCGPWGRLKAFCTNQNKSLGPAAVAQVRRWGGVLEHPADSSLWKHCGIPRPGALDMFDPGFSIYVEQWLWGHKVIKPTWLYIVGLQGALPPVPWRPSCERPSGKGGKWVEVAGVRRRRMAGGIHALSGLERRVSPPAFAQWLIDIAAHCEAP